MKFFIRDKDTNKGNSEQNPAEYEVDIQGFMWRVNHNIAKGLPVYLSIGHIEADNDTLVATFG